MPSVIKRRSLKESVERLLAKAQASLFNRACCCSRLRPSTPTRRQRLARADLIGIHARSRRMYSSIPIRVSSPAETLRLSSYHWTSSGDSCFELYNCPGPPSSCRLLIHLNDNFVGQTKRHSPHVYRDCSAPTAIALGAIKGKNRLSDANGECQE
jgi:hypothetical protein